MRYACTCRMLGNLPDKSGTVWTFWFCAAPGHGGLSCSRHAGPEEKHSSAEFDSAMVKWLCDSTGVALDA